jgi:hypothetical protein
VLGPSRDELGEVVLRGSDPELVEIVDHQHDLSIELGELGDQPLDEAGPVELW